MRRNLDSGFCGCPNLAHSETAVLVIFAESSHRSGSCAKTPATGCRTRSAVITSVTHPIIIDQCFRALCDYVQLSSGELRTPYSSLGWMHLS